MNDFNPPNIVSLLSPQCSVSCGTGTQQRSIDCVDTFGALSQVCAPKKKPLMVQPCSTGVPCPKTTTTAPTITADLLPTANKSEKCVEVMKLRELCVRACVCFYANRVGCSKS